MHLAKYFKYIHFQYVGECPKQTSTTCSKPEAVRSGYRVMAGLINSLLHIRKNVLIKRKKIFVLDIFYVLGFLH